MITIERKTKETNINISLDLEKGYDGTSINTPVPFLNHMLDQIAVHSDIYIKIDAQGDIEIDDHHSVEDIGLCLGEALAKFFTGKKGFARYGYATIPMEEALTTVAIDIRRSPNFSFQGKNLLTGKIGTFDCELVEEFFRALSLKAGFNIHILLQYGFNKHHMVESIFKSFAYAFKMAKQSSNSQLSSKGCL